MATIDQPGVGRLPTPAKKQPNTIRVAPLLVEASQKNADEVFTLLTTSAAGLTQSEAEQRLSQYGPNEVAQAKRHGWLRRLGTAVRNPLVILLTVLAIISFSTGDVPSGVVMMVMVALGVSLRFMQETRADVAAAKLRR
jgi:Mg2+-importing ATPase